LAGSEFGSLHSAQVDSMRVRYTRGANHIRRAGEDVFIASLKLKGTGTVCQDGRQAALSPGDIVLYDTARPFTLDFPQSYSEVVIRIPRKLLSARLPQAESMTARNLSAGSPMGRLAGQFMRECGNLAVSCDAGLRARFSTTLLDVLATAIEFDFLDHRQPDSYRHAASLERIKNWMDKQLGETSLDIGVIAAANAVSPRTLQRLFAAQGDTAMRWLWNRRLEASYRALAEGRVRQVTEAAVECGFSDFSHFSRAFKRTFGVLPNQVLRQGF
jgi:AraC-like DNA-binding protein